MIEFIVCLLISLLVYACTSFSDLARASSILHLAVMIAISRVGLNLCKTGKSPQGRGSELKCCHPGVLACQKMVCYVN